MNVCLINNVYKPYSRGGAGQVVFRLANWLKHHGHNVVVVSLSPAGQKKPPSMQDGVRVIYLSSFYYHLNKLPIGLRFVWHFFQFFNFYAPWRLRRIIKNEKSDLAVFNNMMGFGYLASRFVSTVKKAKILHDIQMLHPSGLVFFGQEGKLETAAAKIFRLMVKLFEGNYDLVVSPSSWLLKQHKDKGLYTGDKTAVLPNPLPGKTRRQNNPGKEIFEIVYIGQIGAYKGVFLLLEAFLSLPRKLRQKAKLTYIGSGDDLPELKKAIDKKAPEGGVRALGYMEEKEFMPILESASLMVVPSMVYENSPTAIYEAAYLGLPVLASDLGGIPELIKQKNQLFEPTVKGLSDRLSAALSEPDGLSAPDLTAVSAGDYWRKLFKELGFSQFEI